MIDIETTSLSGIESGRHFPSMPTVERIANSLKVELKALFDFNHLLSKEQMKIKIIKNIDKLTHEEICFIHKFVEGYKE